jgi:quercetin dioxygenase-like cupin family protein
MKELMEKWDGTVYPDMIRNLPEVDVPFDGVRGWMIESSGRQVAFFDIKPVGQVPPHSHCAQWGFVLDGEMSLTIGGETNTYNKGDWYYIPEGVEHSATFKTRVNVIDVFDSPDRYKTK